jgi:hypothetical protein
MPLIRGHPLALAVCGTAGVFDGRGAARRTGCIGLYIGYWGGRMSL